MPGSVTISANAYAIYGTSAEAVIYHAAGIGAAAIAWAAASSTNQAKSLVEATRMLDRAPWQGALAADGQSLKWPRSGVVDRLGEDVSSASIPLAIEEAAYELAAALLADPTIRENGAAGGSNIASLTAGPVGITYFRAIAGGRFPTIIDELVGQYLQSAASASATLSTASYGTGTDVSSSFDDADVYSLTRG